MMIIACTLFLTAIVFAGYALLTSVSDNIERIYEVIEQRDGITKSARKITIAALRSPASKPAIANSMKLRRSVIAKRKVINTPVQQHAWPLAA
jgi:hypothetical protein